MRRRTTCVRVPILEDDEVQREHERAERVIPTRQPPSAYRPRPFRDNPENSVLQPPPVYTPTSRINPKQTTNSAQSVRNNRNTNNVNGVQQDHRIAQPAAVSQRHSASTDQNTNSVHTYQTQGVTNNAKQTSAVLQGSFRVPPSTNPASCLSNTS